MTPVTRKKAVSTSLPIAHAKTELRVQPTPVTRSLAARLPWMMRFVMMVRTALRTFRSATQGCVNAPINLTCNDGIACTADTCEGGLADGVCKYVTKDANCDDGFECTTDSCSATAGCINTGFATNCDDGVSCTIDSCDPIEDAHPSSG